MITQSLIQLSRPEILVLNKLALRMHPVRMYKTHPATLAPSQLVWYIMIGIEVLIGIRFLLYVAGASLINPSVKAIYTLSDPLVSPFHGPLSAMLIYLTIAKGIVEFIAFTKAANVKSVMSNTYRV